MRETREGNHMIVKKAPAAKAVTASNVVEMKKMRLERVEIPIVGTSALIMHAWSHKAKQQMLDKQMQKATTGKVAKDPQRDFEESMYTDGSGLPCFPTIAFKAAAVDAAVAMSFKKTDLRQAFHIDGDMVPIVGGDPAPREVTTERGLVVEGTQEPPALLVGHLQPELLDPLKRKPAADREVPELLPVDRVTEDPAERGDEEVDRHRGVLLGERGRQVANHGGVDLVETNVADPRDEHAGPIGEVARAA
jgi:hypothetical protein